MKKYICLYLCALLCICVIIHPLSLHAAEIDATKEVEEIEESQKKPHYIIEKDMPVPVSNPNHYGTISIAEADNLKGILAYLRYEGLLAEDEALVYDPNANFYKNSAIDFYYDESILVICWKELINKSVVTFSEIKIGDPSQFRRKLSGDAYNSGRLSYCTAMSRETNAVVAMNADFYSFRNLGVTCYEGTVYRTDQRVDTLYIDENGDFLLQTRGQNKSKEELQAYVDDNSIQFALSFGPTLVQDGQLIETKSYPIGEINDCYSRAGIAQVGPLHYLYATISSYPGTYVTPLRDFGKILYDKGVMQAYTLDGGQTSEMIFNNRIMHNIVYGKERTVSDMIYFASAIPN